MRQARLRTVCKIVRNFCRGLLDRTSSAESSGAGSFLDMSKLFYIYRGNEEPLGPLTYKQVTQKLESGELKYLQLAKGLGINRWTPLEEIMERPPFDPIETRRAEIIHPVRNPLPFKHKAVPTLDSETSASVLRRMAAGFIDSLIITAIHVALVIVALTLAQTIDRVLSQVFLPRFAPAFFLFVMLTYPSFLYAFTLSFMHLILGNSFGKFTMNVGVVDVDNRPISLVRLFARSFLVPLHFYTCGLTLVSVFFLSNKRFLHDYIAGTRVIQK